MPQLDWVSLSFSLHQLNIINFSHDKSNYGRILMVPRLRYLRLNEMLGENEELQEALKRHLSEVFSCDSAEDCK